MRDATISDLDELLRVELASFPAADAFSRRQYRDLLRNPRATVRVARRGDRLVASSILLRRVSQARNHRFRVSAAPRTTARLYSIAVDPTCRGQGLGARMLRDAIALCRREKIARLHLEVRAANAAAIALYRKFGFEVESHLPDYYAPRQHGVKMRLHT
ncbi:MAG: GNAT family N-acetyltransferase [Phycisphaerae bacterium]|nr:GNAT family N-acetyltransferase [Phycisphaerae bacterium]